MKKESEQEYDTSFQVLSNIELLKTWKLVV